MTTERLRNTRNADPFVPFIIYMTNGRSYKVPHRDYLAIHPEGRIATVYGPNGGANTIDIMLVTELSEEIASSASNGPTI